MFASHNKLQASILQWTKFSADSAAAVPAEQQFGYSSDNFVMATNTTFMDSNVNYT
jgi:hypothetical protein